MVSYDRANSPLANALLRHLCVNDSGVGVGASQSLFDVLGGDAPSLDGAKANWKISSLEANDLSKNFKLSCESSGLDAVDVGLLSIKLEEQTKARDATKTPGETSKPATK